MRKEKYVLILRSLMVIGKICYHIFQGLCSIEILFPKKRVHLNSPSGPVDECLMCKIEEWREFLKKWFSIA